MKYIPAFGVVLVVIMVMGSGIHSRTAAGNKHLSASQLSGLTHEQIKKLLPGTWWSTKIIRNGREWDHKDTFRINLRADGNFNSYYKPDNYKKGRWELSGDSILSLHMKASDYFYILGLTDSTLEIKDKYSYKNTVIYQFRKVRQPEKKKLHHR